MPFCLAPTAQVHLVHRCGWDDALQLTPDDAVLYEMKSQVKNCTVELFLAFV